MYETCLCDDCKCELDFMLPAWATIEWCHIWGDYKSNNSNEDSLWIRCEKFNVDAGYHPEWGFNVCVYPPEYGYQSVVNTVWLQTPKEVINYVNSLFSLLKLASWIL